MGEKLYELDCIKRPNYHDGAKRKAWSQLSTVAQWSWCRIPAEVPNVSLTKSPMMGFESDKIMNTEQNTNEAANSVASLNADLGMWTLTAPDGRTFKADTPLKCCALEMRERVPPDVALSRIKESVTCKTCGDRLVGNEDESDTECRWCVTGWKPCPDNGVPMTPN